MVKESAAVRMEIFKEIGDLQMIEEVAKEARVKMAEVKGGVEERVVRLAELSGYKDYFANLIIEKKMKKQQVKKHMPLLLSLLSINDEYLLMILF